MQSSSPFDAVTHRSFWRFSLRELLLIVVTCAAGLALGMKLHAHFSQDVEPQLSDFVSEFDVGGALRRSLEVSGLHARLRKNEDTESFGYSPREQDREYLGLYEGLDGPWRQEVLIELRTAVVADLEQRGGRIVSEPTSPETFARLQFSLHFETPSTRGFVFVKVLELGDQRFALYAGMHEYPIQRWTED